MVKVSAESKERAAQLWDFLTLSRPLCGADCIVVMGGHDIRVAEWAAQVFLEGWAPWLVMSGGLGYYTKTVFREPEARTFAKIAEALGVPTDRVLIETESSNSGENVAFTRCLLRRRGIRAERILVVQKPYLERRAVLTFRAQWPEVSVFATSPALTFDEYPNEQISWERLIREMVGQLHRLIVYPDMGYLEPCEIPSPVVESARQLARLGFDGHLVTGLEKRLFE